ncbi:ATP-binding protein [Nocardiopsis dassonvillei]|uniref:ATP-binding protein n=1 Tax=Nocardiopsis dassonvillei TaxID=2014 RepID=UPI00102BE239|nr:ATP-binding protein [Nocardiopsis dassonvillei]MCP3017140.1 ATP-binding protein [Nocardiopsis dassonvillei]
MTVLPRPRRPLDLDRRWKRRSYSANLAAIRRARADLRADLSRISGADGELVAAVVLCASEMLTSAMGRVLPGGSGAEVVRTLVLRHDPGGRRVLRLSVADRWIPGALASVPGPEADQDWRELALGQGLLLIGHFSARWGTRRAGAPGEDGGRVIWAEFDLAPRWSPRPVAA